MFLNCSVLYDFVLVPFGALFSPEHRITQLDPGGDCGLNSLPVISDLSKHPIWTTYCITHISAHPGIYQGLLIPILSNFQLLNSKPR